MQVHPAVQIWLQQQPPLQGYPSFCPVQPPPLELPDELPLGQLHAPHVQLVVHVCVAASSAPAQVTPVAGCELPGAQTPSPVQVPHAP